VGPAVTVEDLVVRHGDTVAVDGVSFTVEAGEVVVLLGPNGAGKTTTVETLQGLRRPDSGSVRVLGLDPVAEHGALVSRLGVMPQRGGVYPGIRPLEALVLFAAYFEDPVDPEELLDRVGLRSVARSTWRQLSGGEQQRLSLALALVGRPEVAFLDEPTSGVDVGGRAVLRSLVADLAGAGAAVLLTTHELDEGERVADRVVIIDRGRVRAEGRPSELRSTGAGAEIRFAASGDVDTAALAAALGAAVTEVSDGEYRVATEATPATVADLTAWLAEHDLVLGDLRAGRSSLEDVFLRLVGEADGGPR